MSSLEKFYSGNESSEDHHTSFKSAISDKSSSTTLSYDLNNGFSQTKSSDTTGDTTLKSTNNTNKTTDKKIYWNKYFLSQFISLEQVLWTFQETEITNSPYRFN